MTLEECRGRWRVLLDDEVIDYFSRRRLLEELENWRRELEDSLNGDPQTITRLLREPVVYEIGGVKRRRYRLYLRGKPYRLVFLVNVEKCIIVFLLALRRDEETYKKMKRRKK